MAETHMSTQVQAEADPGFYEGRFELRFVRVVQQVVIISAGSVLSRVVWGHALPGRLSEFLGACILMGEAHR